jgi:hypothetical protein
MREEALTAETPAPAAEPPPRRPVNPLAAGLGTLLVGAGLTLLFPFVGIGIMILGAIAVVWGIIISAVRE